MKEFIREPKKRLVKNTRISINNLFIFVIMASLSVLLAGSFFTMIINGSKYNLLGKIINTKTDYKVPQRGIFFDNQSVSLVENIPGYSISFNPLKLKSIAELDNISDIIAKNSSENLTEIKTRMEDLVSSNQKGLITKVLAFDEISKILASVSEITNSLEIKEVFFRKYNYPESFSHILGYLGKTTTEEIDGDSFYMLDDFIGKYKLENSLEIYLRGVKGKVYNQDGVEKYSQPIPGFNVYLNINSIWQDKLYNIIANQVSIDGAEGGSGVVMDINSGKVLALVSYPGFNTNQFSPQINISYYSELLQNPQHPLIDKALTVGGPPGSTFKIISAMHLLENQKIDSKTTYFSNRCINLGNYEFCEYGKFFYGLMDLPRALYKSSNLFFCDAFLKQDNDFVQSLFDFAKSLGLDNLTNIDIPGEITGNVDSPEYKESTLGEPWYDGDTCNMVIGQGATLVTPVQLVVMISAIENGGSVLKPYVISSIEDQFGNIMHAKNKEVLQKVNLNYDNLKLVDKGLYGNVLNPEGIVYRFLHDIGETIRVKTGTAEVIDYSSGSAQNKTHGWIVGAFDYQGNTYAFTFNIRFGSSGSNASIVARKFIYCVYNNNAPGCENI